MANHGFFQHLFNKKDPVYRAVEEAIDLMDEGDHDGAIAVLRDRALRRDPGNRRALLHLGVAHMLKGELDTAEEFFVPLATTAEEMHSEKAAAQIALERVAVLRKEREKENRQA